MSHEGFSLRHRGAHVPDHLRRLEEISTTVVGSPRARRHGINGPARLVESHGSVDPAFATLFRNFAVWVDHALHSATAHAGYEKVHLYMAILRGFVDDVVPHPELQRVVEEIEAYVAYLSSSTTEACVETLNQPRRPLQPAKPAATTVVSPRTTSLSKTVLSPRVLRAMAKDVPPQAAATSPRIIKKRPKKIIELSDHEEAILEIALYYKEVLAQLSSASVRFATTKQPAATKRTKPSLTEQWLLLSMEKRTHVLKKIKSSITKHTLFPSSSSSSPLSSTSNTIPTTPSGTRVASGGAQHPAAAATIHQFELSSYFSLIILCLQETTRRISVLSAEVAAFLWTTVIQDTLQTVEGVLMQVLARHRQAQDALERLKLSRSNVHDAIAHCEHEIQRLQAQNVRSLAVWELEKAEMTMLEQEEEWHGHCKSLIYKSLRALQEEIGQSTWYQTGTSSVNTTVAAKESVEHNTEPSPPVESIEPLPVRYQRLPVGAALLHSGLRARVVYITHLVVLCRSFLHLHEKRALREVMEATSTNPRWSELLSPSSSLTHSTALDIFDVHHPPPTTPAHGHAGAMERISTNELLTLKDINDALRAIEELYASTGGSGDHSHVPSSVTATVALRGNDVATQFPVIGVADPATGSGFVRALAYSTVVAGNPTHAPTFIRAGHTSPTRRNAEVASVRMPMPLGSGRRMSSKKLLEGDSTLAAPTQPMLRLHKAVTKLPHHVRDVLLLPLLQSEPFPADHATSIVESLTKDEILARIQWIYGLVIDSTMTPLSTTMAAPAGGVPGSGTPIPLVRHLWKRWNTEQFVAFVHAAFLDKCGSDVALGEREFVRFCASIQLLFSGLGGALHPVVAAAGGAGASQAMDKISFFTRMTQLVQLDAPDPITKHRLPAQLFPVFFYCLHVLQQVAVTRKHIDDGGLSMDIWTVPAASSLLSPPLSPTRAEASMTPFTAYRSQRARVVPTAAATETFRSHALHASQFVLLESVKTLLLYLLEATSPDAGAVVDERIQFLSDRATLAKVALLSPVQPGSYELNGVSAQSPARSTSSPLSRPVANGELTDAWIVPLDFAVLTIASAWLQQHHALVDRLSVAMRAASVASPSGDMAFDEFTHVMLVGAAAPTSATATGSAVRTNQLTQIYASLLARGHGNTTRRRTKATVKWQALSVAVADEIDLLGMTDRLELVDMRSIQHAVVRGSGRGATASPWVAKPTYRGGDAHTLRRVWDANRTAMQEHFNVAFQAENALEGIALWQTGVERMDRVETLLRHGVQSRTPARKASNPHEPSQHELTSAELTVAWRALYYLQLDHTQAVHATDHVRANKQVRTTTRKPSVGV